MLSEGRAYAEELVGYLRQAKKLSALSGHLQFGPLGQDTAVGVAP